MQSAPKGTQMTQFTLDNFLPYRLNLLAEAISREFAVRYRAHFGLSVAEWRVLAHLSGSQPVSVREIHERAHLDKSRISRAAARLAEAGLLRKSGNETDRRLVTLELTEEGRALMAEIAPLAEGYQQELLETLGADGPEFRAMVEKLLARAPE